jgi:hypothetical protein
MCIPQRRLTHPALALQVRIQKESEVRLRIVGTRNDANEIVRPSAQSKAARHIRERFHSHRVLFRLVLRRDDQGQLPGPRCACHRNGYRGLFSRADTSAISILLPQGEAQ